MGLPPGPTIGCIAPGKVGAAYANKFGTTSADIPGAMAFQYQLSGTVSGASPSVPTCVADSIAPTVTDMLDTVRKDVTGTATATGPISNVQMRAYAKDRGAHPGSARGAVSDLGSLTAGQSWIFSTTLTMASVVSYVDYATYTDGQ